MKTELLRITAWPLLIAYIWFHRHDNSASTWLLTAFIVMFAVANFIDYRRRA